MNTLNIIFIVLSISYISFASSDNKENNSIVNNYSTVNKDKNPSTKNYQDLSNDDSDDDSDDSSSEENGCNDFESNNDNENIIPYIDEDELVENPNGTVQLNLDD